MCAGHSTHGGLRVLSTPPPVLSASNHALLLNPDSPEINRRAPALFRVRFATTQGDIVFELHRDWAPLGVDRFYNLVRAGYYDDTRFYRVVKDRWTQFGINGDPEISKIWRTRTLPDEPRRASNARGTIAFAFAAPGMLALLLALPLIYWLLRMIPPLPRLIRFPAIRLLIGLCRETRCRVHIVHLSSADALPMIAQARNEGLPLFVETCPHYLFFAAEEIPDGDPLNKCAPPIRERENRELQGFAGVELSSWDIGYFAEKQRQSLYEFDEEELRPYFPAERVLAACADPARLERMPVHEFVSLLVV